MLETSTARFPNRTAAILLVSLLVFSFAAAAQTGTIAGEVLDSSGKPVVASVEILSADGMTAFKEETNKKGKFTATLAPGTYTVRLNAPGHAATESQVEVKTNTKTASKLPILTGAEMARNVYNEGIGALQSGDLTVALTRFEYSTELDPTLPQAWLGQVLVHGSNGSWQEAATAIEKVKSTSSEPMVPPFLLFQAALETGRDDWLSESKAQLVGTPDASEAAKLIFNRGVAAVRAEDEARAVSSFEEALALDPKLASAHQSLAAVSFNKQEFDQALPHIETLLELDGANASGQRMAFFTYMNLGRADAAKGAFEAWSRISTTASKEALDYAEEQFELDKRDTAMTVAEAVVTAVPNNGQAHYLKGRLLAARGDVPGAKAALAKFLELAPDDPDASAARQMMEGF